MSTSDLSLEVEAQDSPDLADLARYTGLSSLEIAAAKTDFHMSTCPLPVWECPDCAHKLKEIRAILGAVKDRIALAERVQIVTDVRRMAEETRAGAYTPSAGVALGAVIDSVADRINILPPVAAASNPTPIPIPDGEGE